MNQGQTVFSQVLGFFLTINFAGVLIAIVVTTAYVLLHVTISLFAWHSLNWPTVKAYGISFAV